MLPSMDTEFNNMDSKERLETKYEDDELDAGQTSANYSYHKNNTTAHQCDATITRHDTTQTRDHLDRTKTSSMCKSLVESPSIFHKLTTPLRHHLTRHNHDHLHNSSSDKSKHSSNWSLVAQFWLPLLILLLLPRFEPSMNSIRSRPDYQQQQQTSSFLSTATTSQLLLALMRFPWDRLQLVSFGPLAVGATTTISQQTNAPAYVGKVSQLQQNGNPLAVGDRQDLVEEESHMLILNPGEAGLQRGQQQVPLVYQQNPYRASQQQQQHSQHMQPADSYEPSANHMVMQPGYEHAPGQQTGSTVDAYGVVSGVDQSASGDMLSPAAHLQLQPDSSSSNEHASRQRTAPMVQSSSQSGLQTRADLPSVSALNVKCEKNHMKVNIVFDRPFYGVVFSKGHYNDKKCVHLPPNSGQTTVNFEINMGKCGLRDSRQTLLQDGSSESAGGIDSEPGQQQHLQQQYGSQAAAGQQPHGVYIENTIVIQYDSQVQEIYDQARRLRCTWYDYYEKSVTFRPYDVDMLDAVTANFLGDNIQCWMQIQVGKGPKSNEVAGLVKIGQTMTMVLAIKDDENRFDMLVRNCIAHDGKHPPIQLVDEYGCVARPKIMGQFQKSRNFGPQATVVSYAHFQAFKFPDSLSVHFQCVIQVCRTECPPLNCGNEQQVAPGGAQPTTSAGASQTVGYNMGLNSPGSSGGDYATSGTEVVATKEPSPLHHQSSMMMTGGSPLHHQMSLGNNAYPLMPMNASSALPSGYHQIKLPDDSQGRIQVKLDTSLLAGAGSRYAPAPVMGSQALGGGAVPPSSAAIGSPHLSSGGLATPIQGFQLPRGQTHRYQQHPNTSGMMSSSSAGSNAYKPVYGGAQSISSVPPGGRVPLSSSSQRGPQTMSHFSPQYPSSNMAAAASMVQRAAYATNRIGELAPGARSTQDEQLAASREDQSSVRSTFEPEATGSDLSLLATPRALKSNGNQQHQILIGSNNNEINHQQQRFRRSLPSENLQSTSIQTQKTIQVISPDDVAFNLNGPTNSASNPIDGLSITQTPGNLMLNQEGGPTTVCFSAARFLVAILFSMSLLVVSLVVAGVLLFRQQQHNRFRQKEVQFMSMPYETSAAAQSNPRTSIFEQPQQQSLHNQQTMANNNTTIHPHEGFDYYPRRIVGGYLNRIYSQFSTHSNSGWHN